MNIMNTLEKRIVKLVEDYDTYAFRDAFGFNNYDDAMNDVSELINKNDETLIEYVQEIYEWYKGDGYDEELEQEAFEILTILRRIYAM